MDDINFNEVLISGIINVITDTNGKYIKFGLTTNKYTLNEDKKVYLIPIKTFLLKVIKYL